MKLFAFWVLLFCLAPNFSANPAFAQENSLSPRDKLFIKYAASVALLEIQLGQLAHDRGGMPAVKEFAERMVRENTRAKTELETIAAKRNLKLPNEVERRHKSALARLSTLYGGDFDGEYLQATIKNSVAQRAQLKKAIKSVQDQELKVWAIRMLPVVE